MLTVNSLPSDYRWANDHEAENSQHLTDAIYVRRDFDQVDIAVPHNHPVVE